MNKKTVIITGASRGIGKSTAEVFAKNNYNVVIMDVNKDALYDAEMELAKIKSKARVVSLVCDITNEKDVSTALDTIDTYAKRIDIWINNAGVNQPQKAIWELDENEINTIINQNENIPNIPNNIVLVEDEEKTIIDTNNLLGNYNSTSNINIEGKHAVVIKNLLCNVYSFSKSLH